MDYAKLLDYCKTEREVEIIQACIKGGSGNKAAAIVGCDPRNVHRTVTKVQVNAANQGYAPGHWEHGVAAGRKMGKVTIARGPNGEIERTWERQLTDPEQLALYIAEALENFKPKPIPKIKAPTKKQSSDLLTLYTITDFHLGMYAWAAECGEDWDTTIACRTLINAINEMAERSPDAETAILNIQGDFMHWDGMDALTPANRHVLDADTRIGQLIDLALDMTMWAIERLLQKHKKVLLFVCEGNHDLVSSKWIPKAMARIFRKNPRLEVDKTEFPYYAHLHGDTMIGLHHGHKKNNKSLPTLFASEPRFRMMWGQATYCYIHTGHYHHAEQDMAEGGGAIVERHPTLSTRDAYSARGGYVSRRAARAITYHTLEGEVSRVTVVPR